MHTTTLNRHGFSGSVFHALQRAAQSLVDAVAGHFSRKRAYAILMSMDDRQLRDIGVNRGDISYLVYGRKKDSRTPLKWVAVDKRQPLFN